jgi:hypothetical protein
LYGYGVNQDLAGTSLANILHSVTTAAGGDKK